MTDERKPPAATDALSALAAELAAARADMSTVKANVSSLRADMFEAKAAMSEAKADRTMLKAGMTEAKADLTSAMSDIIRLDQKIGRMAAALAGAQADVQKIVLSMATKNDVAKILDAIEVLVKKTNS